MRRSLLTVLWLCLLWGFGVYAQDDPNAPAPDMTLVLPPSGATTAPPSTAMPPGAMMPPTGAMPPGAMMPQQQEMPTPLGRLFAVHASGGVPQKLQIDKKLKALKPLFSALPYTSYEALAIHDRELPWGEETLFPVNALYAMKVTPLGPTEENAIALQARVELLHDGEYVNALDTLAEAHMNQALLFRGLPLGSDELLLVLVVAMPSDDQQEQQQNEEDQEDASEQEDEEDQNQEQDQEDASEQEGEEEQDAELMPQEGEEDGQDPSELDAVEEEEAPEENNENLEALLQSLEETDKREQVEERNKRSSVDIKGNWW